MNYGDQHQQQYIMQQQGQRIQNPRVVMRDGCQMAVPANMAMQRQQRYSMTMIQPTQQPMQIAPNQYVSAAQMQPRASMSINDALSRLPIEVQQMAQQQINAESNVERKKQIALNIIQTHRMRIPQAYQTPSGPMSGSAVMVNMGGNQQQMSMASGNLSNSAQIIRMNTSQGGQMTPQTGSLYPNQNAVMQGTSNMSQITSTQCTTMQRVVPSTSSSASHAYQVASGMTASPSTTQATHMMQQQQFNTTNANSSSSSSQDQNITNTNNTNTTSATTILPNYNSPQSSLIIQQPSSVGVTSMQQTALQHRGPMSVPSAIYQQHPHDGGMTNVQLMSSNEADKAATEEPLYSQKLEQLKAYQDQIRRIIERNRLDGQQPKQKYERLIEIMEGRRKVDLNLMEKLIVSVKCTVERSSVCYPLLEIARIDSNSLLSDTLKSSLPDPWIDFRQYSIKVPDEVIAITNENINKQSPQKRNASFGGVASKRIKKEDGLPVSVSVDEKKVIGASEKRILVDCSDGSKIELSNEVCGELRNARFRFDTDLLPISSESTEVHVLIENDSLLVPPLRLVIPVKYPEVGASIWRDQWSFGSDLDSEVNVHFEKRLAMTNNSSSVAEIINAWRIACEHAIRVS